MFELNLAKSDCFSSYCFGDASEEFVDASEEFDDATEEIEVEGKFFTGIKLTSSFIFLTFVLLLRPKKCSDPSTPQKCPFYDLCGYIEYNRNMARHRDVCGPESQNGSLNRWS